VVAENFNTARRSPHLEVFRKRGIEVLLLSDRIDEWLMSHLQEYAGKPLQDVARGELDLGEDEKAENEKLAEESKGLLERIKGALEGDVADVRASARLTDSAACLVVGEHELGAQMRRIMEAAGQPVPDSKPTLEINPTHPLIALLDRESDEDRFGDLARVVFDQATLAEGGQLDDPASYVDRVNRLLLELAGR
jgi:molecular chaperone HtpG